MSDKRTSRSRSEDCLRAEALMLDCQDREGGDVTPEMLAYVDDHVSTCPACQVYQRQMTDMVAALRDLPMLATPPGLEERIMARISEERRPLSVTMTALGSGRGWLKSAPVAAAVLMLALVWPGTVQTPQPALQGTDIMAHVSGSRDVNPGRGHGPAQAADTDGLSSVADSSADETAMPAEALRALDATLVAWFDRDAPQLHQVDSEGLQRMVTSAGPSGERLTGSVSQGGFRSGRIWSPVQHIDGRGTATVTAAEKTASPEASSARRELALASSATSLTSLWSEESASSWEQEGDLYYDPLSALVGF